jgi:hypothetical protein
MSRLRHWLILPIVLGVALGFTALQLGSGTASAQYYGPGGATVSCPGGWPGSCTIMLSAPVPPGTTISATMPDGSTVTINCASGASAGDVFMINGSAAAYATPQLVYSSYSYTPAYISVIPVYSTYYTTPSYSYAPAYPTYYTQPAYTTYYTQPAYTTYYTTLPDYVTPPTYYSYTPVYQNGYWWSWNNNQWSWSDGHDWHNFDRDDNGYANASGEHHDNNNGNSWCTTHPGRC